MPSGTNGNNNDSGDSEDTFGALPFGIGSDPWGNNYSMPQCECGSWKTYGKYIESWQHSDFCPVYRKKPE